MSEHRYARPKVPAVLELTAQEIHPALLEVVHQAKSRATAEEALAVAIDLWDDMLALETDVKTSKRKRNSSTEQVLLAGQKMALKSALTRHLARHRHLVRKS